MIATVTHARIRAAQGDLAGARRILEEVLRGSPDNVEARELLRRYAGRGDSASTDTPSEPLSPPEPADAESLADAFRRTLGSSDRNSRPEIERLRAWLRRVSDRSR